MLCKFSLDKIGCFLALKHKIFMGFVNRQRMWRSFLWATRSYKWGRHGYGPTIDFRALFVSSAVRVSRRWEFIRGSLFGKQCKLFHQFSGLTSEFRVREIRHGIEDPLPDNKRLPWTSLGMLDNPLRIRTYRWTMKPVMRFLSECLPVLNYKTMIWWDRSWTWLSRESETITHSSVTLCLPELISA